MSKRDIEKLMEVYVCNPNVYEYAYSNCQEYKTFIDNLSEDALSKIKRAHAAWKISNGTDKFREGLFHTATFGLSFGAKKLLNRNKKSKQEMIVEMVESEEFIGFFKALNKCSLT